MKKTSGIKTIEYGFKGWTITLRESKGNYMSLVSHPTYCPIKMMANGWTEEHAEAFTSAMETINHEIQDGAK